METFTPTRRMVSGDGGIGKRRELAQALDGLSSAMCAHAAYYHDPAEIMRRCDELRAELGSDKPDKARIESLFEQVAAGLKRPTADSRMLAFVDDAVSRARSALAAL